MRSAKNDNEKKKKKKVGALLAAGLLATGLLMAAGAADAASSVTLTGTIGQRAILIVDGAPPKTLTVGERHRDVRLVSLQDGQAVVETADGRRATLRMDTPVSIGGTARAPGGGGTRIVLPAGSGGHFMADGSINGRAVRFMLDTGATTIALSAADAGRIGLDYQAGAPVRIHTANGIVQGWRVTLDAVRVGDVEVAGVEAIVAPQPMPYVLRGNSFIGRFTMRRDSDQMVLEKRY